jgi:hypothetical protein
VWSYTSTFSYVFKDWEVIGWNLRKDADYYDWAFRGFPQSVSLNVGTLYL